MRVLADTCVWSEALRRKKAPESEVAHELGNLIAENRVEIIGAVRQEILSGVRSEPQFQELAKWLVPFPDIPVETGDYVMAARFFNQCRGKEVQGSNTDFLICAMSVRHRLAIFTSDKDYLHFSKHLPIVLYKPEEY